MKKLLTACLLILGSFTSNLWSQVFAIDPIYYTIFDKDSLYGFDETAARASAISEGYLGSEFKVRMYRLKREYIDNKYNIAPAVKPSNTPNYLNTHRPAAVPGCVNEDFEASTAAAITASGQITGWVVTAGYNGYVSPTSTLSTYYPGGLTTANSCNLLGCCPMPPANSALIDCSAGFVDPQIGNQYPIYSVFGTAGTTSVAAAGVNPQITTPMLGTKVLRLNDGITGDYSMEKLSKTFAVTNQNALFQFAFISVFSPGHGCCDAGGMQIRLSNATANTVIPCPNFSVSAPSSQCTATVPVDYFIAGTGAPYTTTSSASSIYNRWKINSMDLSAYIGQNITIDIIISDCTAGGHFGEVYFDAQCGPMTISGNGTLFDAGIADVIVPTCGASGATICAAAGLGPYYWAGPGVTPNQATPSMTNQCFTSTISATYTLFMQPQGSCVPITRVVTSTITPAPLLVGSVVQASCGNTLAIVSVTPSGSAANPSKLIWSPTALSLNSTTTIGQYQIPALNNTLVVSVTASDPLGCLITTTLAVNPAPPYPTFTLVNMTNSYSITCVTPSVQIDANSNYNYNNGSLNYFWSSNTATFTGNSNIITTAGIYTVYALDPVTNCGVTNTVQVGINTTVPNSTVSPASQVINCNMPSVPDVTLTSGPAVNITHYVSSPLGGTFAVGGQVASYPIGVPGTYTYCLVNDVNGCSTCKTFTVNANQGFPTFNLSSPQSFTLGCTTKSIAIINITGASATNTNQIPTGGPVSYTLLAPGASSATPPGTLSSAATYTVNSPGTWTVIVKDNNSFCESRSAISILSNTFAPDISAIVPQQTLSCFVPHVLIKGQSLTNNVSYEWGFQGLNQSTDTLAININPAAPNNSIITVYTLTIKDNSSTCKTTSIITMYQNLYKPKPVISNGGVSAISCKTSTVTLTNQSSTGIPAGTGYPTNLPAVGYLWQGPTPQEDLNLSTTYLAWTPGVYTLTVRDNNNGCTSFTTVSIDDQRDYPDIAKSQPVSLECGALTASLKADVTNGLGNLSYSWTPVGPITCYTCITTGVGLGEHQVLVTNTLNGCASINSYTVINGTLTANFSPDYISGFAPLTVNLTNNSQTSNDNKDGAIKNIAAFWNFGNGSSATLATTAGTTTTYKLPGTYTITLYSSKGSCVQSFQKVITVDLPSKLVIPNIFTPNNDKVNDVFRLDAASLSQITMVILDRWGHVVYELTSSTGNVEWDGKNQKGVECAEGVYFYTIKATGADGNEFDKTGNITLAR